MTSKRIFFDRAIWADEARALESLEIPGALVIGFDLANSAAALGAIVMARRAGTPVAVLCVYREPLETLTHNITASIAQTADPDLQIKQIRAYYSDTLVLSDGKTPRELGQLPVGIPNITGFTVRICDLLLLQTPQERERLARFSGKDVLRTAILEAPQATATPQKDGVVIFAPGLSRGQLAGYEWALAARGIKPQIICAENSAEPIAGALVVLPEWWRGLTARSLAHAGFGVAVPVHNGAEVFHSAIVPFDPKDLQTLGDALDVCWSRKHTAPALRAMSPRETLESDVSYLREGPLVSVVVRTKNRPELLKRAIDSIARQVYRSIEIVLVNNAGVDVESLARETAPNLPVRYINIKEAVDIGPALNAGARAATGKYVGYLDDDDILYPDHISRCVDFLERGHHDFVYTNCVGEYAQVVDGNKTVLGMQVYTDNPYRIDDLYAGNLATIHSVVHLRSLFERFGYFDETLPVTEDWELWLRMAAGGARLARLNRPTCEYSWRHDPANQNTSIARMTAFIEAYDVILARYAAYNSLRRDTLGVKQLNNADHLRARTQAVRENPETATQFVMNDLLPTAVPVEGLRDELE